ncbi:hypothetical protein E2P81_ATG11590 [Venturia nashicola]|uniref:Uncharacterized protein n=1 Tax=Venturia nashicola TaxID=86259 RepID=A0A4Z1NHR8_9PEZI|nr:hypothetical protein E6O75_ATG11283 [Venturia nashicola]TLD18680.1 hypothetical protein E2P81_ATG11590 [Venturia nashicola]
MARTATKYQRPLEKISEKIQVTEVKKAVSPDGQKEREAVSEKGWVYGALPRRVEHVEDIDETLRTHWTNSIHKVSSLGADLQEVQELADDRLQRISELEAKFASYAADVEAMERLKRDNEALRKRLEESNKELDMSRRQRGELESSNFVGEQHSTSAPVLRSQPKLSLQVPDDRPSLARTAPISIMASPVLILLPPSPPPPTPTTPVSALPPPPPPPSPNPYHTPKRASITKLPSQSPQKMVRFAPEVQVTEIESVRSIGGPEVVEDQDMDMGVVPVFIQKQPNSHRNVNSVPVDVLQVPAAVLTEVTEAVKLKNISNPEQTEGGPHLLCYSDSSSHLLAQQAGERYLLVPVDIRQYEVPAAVLSK